MLSCNFNELFIVHFQDRMIFDIPVVSAKQEIRQCLMGFNIIILDIYVKFILTGNNLQLFYCFCNMIRYLVFHCV